MTDSKGFGAFPKQHREFFNARKLKIKYPA